MTCLQENNDRDSHLAKPVFVALIQDGHILKKTYV